MTKRICRGKFQNWPTGNAMVSDTTALQLRRILGGAGWEHGSTTLSGLASAAQSTNLNTERTVVRTA